MSGKRTSRWSVAALAAIGCAVLGGALLYPGCAEPRAGEPAASAPLAGLAPETRERMDLVMNKVGQYYVLLGGEVEGGQLEQAATRAEAIAALGGLLAPSRDPAMPAEYVSLQAEFDEAARELAVAARLNQLHETNRRFGEMQHTCRRCHATYHVTLGEPYADVSGSPAPADQ